MPVLIQFFHPFFGKLILCSYGVNVSLLVCSCHRFGTMGKKKKTVKPGVGTKCSILTKFLRPPPFADIESLEEGHRTNVTLLGEKTVTKKKQEMKCFTCTIDGWEDGDAIFWAACSQFKKEKEGPEDLFFTPLTQEEKEERKESKTSDAFVEPKIKWRKSKAKKILYEMIMEGMISDMDDASEDLQEIYLMNEEFSKYDFGKFADRLKTLRTKIQELNVRAQQDEIAFQTYIKNHKHEVLSVIWPTGSNLLKSTKPEDGFTLSSRLTE